MPAIGFNNPYTNNRLRDLYLNTPMPPPSLGSITGTKRGLGQIVSDAVSGKLKPIVGKRMADKAAALLDYSPVAAATTGAQLGQDVRHGDWLSALNNALSTALNVFPDGGALAAKGGAGVLHSIIAPLFHGSPHKFEKFALDKIGTGEGAQAYGHGLYFAEKKGVAKSYMDALSEPTIDGRGMRTNEWEALRAHDAFNGDIPKALAFAQSEAAKLRAAGAHPFDIEPAEMRAATLKAWAAKMPQIDRGGHLYEVKLDANPKDFLDWDAPLSEQATGKALAQRDFDLASQKRAAMGIPSAGFAPASEIQTVLNHLGPQLPEVGRSLGIPGIRYLDQGSRAAASGTSNYVVFDPSIIDILKRY